METDDFERIVEDHQAMVFRVLGRLVGSRDIEDAAQEVFLRLYRALPHFRGEAKLSTYVYRIAINVARDEVGRRGDAAARTISLSDPDGRWDDRLEHGDPLIDGVLEDRERWQAVQEALSVLGKQERLALVLFHQDVRTTTDGHTPAMVDGLANVVAIAAGAEHALAIGAVGQVCVWGGNNSGQLGNNTTTNRSAPALVTGVTGGVRVAAGGSDSLVSTATGELWAWGLDTSALARWRAVLWHSLGRPKRAHRPA